MIHIGFKNLENVQKSFNDKIYRSMNPKQIMDLIGGQARKDVLKHFDDQTGPKTKWMKWNRKLPDGTRKFYSSRPYERFGNKLLENYNTLRTSIRSSSNNKKAEVYTNVEYAAHHQFGTKKMAARPFMWLTKTLASKFVNLLAIFINIGRL